MDKVLRGVIKQPVSVFIDFVNRLDGELVSTFWVGLEKAYSDNSVECPVFLTHISGLALPVFSGISDRESGADSGPSSWKRRTGGKTPRHRGSGKNRDLC